MPRCYVYMCVYIYIFLEYGTMKRVFLEAPTTVLGSTGNPVTCGNSPSCRGTEAANALLRPGMGRSRGCRLAINIAGTSIGVQQ